MLAGPRRRHRRGHPAGRAGRRRQAAEARGDRPVRGRRALRAAARARLTRRCRDRRARASRRTAELAAQYLDTLVDPADPARRRLRHDAPRPSTAPCRRTGMDAGAVVDELAAIAEPGLTAMGSGRYFGFVIGGALPASLATDWLVSTWDQNAGLAQPTPAVSALEAVTGRWVLELLGLPAHSSFAFVTGCQMAHVTSLAAARQAVYERIGYDLREQGLAGAPPLRVVVGEKRHVTLTRALRLLGIGRAQELVVPVDDQGRMRAELLESVLAERRDSRRSSARRPARSTRERSTTSSRSSRSPTRTTPGFTSTARSASGPPRARRSLTSSRVTPQPTRGPPTPTSGSTSRTTAASRSAPIRRCTRQRWSTPPRTWLSEARPSATRWATAPSSRAARARCRRGPPSARSGGAASRA